MADQENKNLKLVRLLLNSITLIYLTLIRQYQFFCDIAYHPWFNTPITTGLDRVIEFAKEGSPACDSWRDRMTAFIEEKVSATMESRDDYSEIWKKYLVDNPFRTSYLSKARLSPGRGRRGPNSIEHHLYDDKSKPKWLLLVENMCIHNKDKLLPKFIYYSWSLIDMIIRFYQDDTKDLSPVSKVHFLKLNVEELFVDVIGPGISGGPDAATAYLKHYCADDRYSMVWYGVVWYGIMVWYHGLVW